VADRGRLYYGWVILGTLSITEVTSWGILYYTFPVFLGPMQQDLGWSRVDLTGAFSLALLVSGLAGVPVGRGLDRHGPRGLMTAGSILAALLVGAWALVADRLAFYAIWAGLGATMAAVLYEPAFQAVATWFRRYRSRALTLLTFAGGFASVIYVPLTDALVRGLGWRAALGVLAVILAGGTVLPHALLLRRRPADLGQWVDGDAPVAPILPALPATLPVERSVATRDALRAGPFWGLAAAFGLINFAASAISFHLIPYLVERGQSPAFAAAVGGGIGLLALPGRLVFTPLGTRVPRSLVTAGLFALQAAGLAVLVAVPGTVGIGGFVLLFGAGFGALTPARAALVADRYGPAAYGSINGVLALVVTLARALAPVAVGLGAAGAGGYPLALWALAGLSAAGILPLYLAAGRPRLRRPAARPATPG
jgi:MFS family permease